ARLEQVHGPDIARALLEVQAPEGDPALEAWVGPPSLTRADARLEQVFLNGRHIRDRTVAHAVREAYRDLLPPGGRRPIAFLFLHTDPDHVDVNVHPGKTEVRWQDAGAVHRVVRRALRSALEQARPGVSVPLAGERAASREAAVEAAFLGGQGSTLQAEERGFAFTPRAFTGTAPAVHEDTSSAAHVQEPVGRTPSGLRPIGQALGTYLLLEGEGELVLVDQHALHERVLFDQINARLREKGNLEVQRLLVPVVVHLDPADAARLAASRELLQTLGWIVEPFGDDAVAVNGVPAVLRRPDPEAALQELLSVLDQGRREGLDRTHLLSAAVDSLACRSAVMAGDVLHPDEVLALLEQAEALNHSHSCPHGRPTRLTMSRSQLERWFHRTV
ncbi:MAG: hypothetical protein QNJ90_15630, partial [Planctomycetota bacterium]|nr:hypothetical protein [Planctomycetota bacterium]